LFLFNFLNDTWNINNVSKAHIFGVNAVSWINLNTEKNTYNSRFVSGGNDYLIKQWEVTSEGKIELVSSLEKVHSSPIKSIDVYLSDEISNTRSNIIATVDVDDEVFLWTPESSSDSFDITFKPEAFKFFNEHKANNITHLTWSKCGTYLSISTLDSTYLYKNYDKEWVIFSSVNQEGQIVNHYEEN